MNELEQFRKRHNLKIKSVISNEGFNFSNNTFTVGETIYFVNSFSEVSSSYSLVKNMLHESEILISKIIKKYCQ